MANKKNNKQVKKTVKKNNKKVNKNNKNNMIIFLVIILFTVFLLGLIIGINKSKKVVCNKYGKFNNGVKQSNEMLFKLNNNYISKVTVNKIITIDKSFSSDTFNYVDIIKKSLEDAYKKAKVDYKISKKQNVLYVTVTYDKKEKYILDNIDLAIEKNNVSVNILTEDNYNNYASIDLNKKYTKDKLIEEYKTKGFICK